MNSTIQENKMKSENVIYKDKNDIVITRLSIRAGRALYALNDISDYRVVQISPNRKPWILTTAIGSATVLITQMEFISANELENFPALETPFFAISPFQLINGLGYAIIAVGLLGLLFARSLHALEITMGSEPMNIIISRRRDIIKKIAVALGIGLRNFHAKERSDTQIKSNQQAHSYANPNQ